VVEQLPLGSPSFAGARINKNSESVERRCDSTPEFSYTRVHDVPLLHRSYLSEIAVAALGCWAQQTIQPWKAFHSRRAGISTFMNMATFFNRIQHIISVSVVFFALWGAAA
jgi:hypothetical protein